LAAPAVAPSKGPDEAARLPAADAARDDSTILSDAELASLISDMNSHDYRRISSAAQKLSRSRETRAVAPLVTVLRESDFFWSRFMSAYALGKIGSYDAIAPLLDALATRDANIGVSDSAQRAVEEIVGLSTPPNLDDAVDVQEYWRKWWLANESAIRRGNAPLKAPFADRDAQAARAERETKFQHLVVNAVSHDPEQSMDAIDGLGELGDARGVPILTDLLLNHGSTRVRLAVLGALERLMSYDSVPALIKVVGDPELDVELHQNPNRLLERITGGVFLGRDRDLKGKQEFWTRWWTENEVSVRKRPRQGNK
jgi:HEAT repeat protein